MSASRILVTGSTGFIGARLCERLAVDYKLPYRALVRDFSRAPRIARLGAEMVGGHLDDLASLDRALDGCDTIVHLAYSDGPQTRRLIRACRKRGIQRFVHMSSIAVHGANPGQECAREETARIGHYPGQEYSNMKAAAERVVQRAIGEGLRAVILRPTIVYGPYGPFVTSIVDAARERGTLTLLDEGRGVCNAVYVDDVCDAIRAAIQTEHGVGSAFFVNADRAVTWREFNLAFANMVEPRPRTVSVRSDEVHRYWESQRPNLRANIAAVGRLVTSAELHRQLSTVPVFHLLITGSKRAAKSLLSPERLAILKDLRATTTHRDAGAGSAVVWPDMGRVTRECMNVEFSNERARTLLGWRPRYDLPAGAALTRTWLEFANALAAES
ncbi:MAG TPA: NAD-dependent epimerase/dehydratase family protein [Methylomirabilota bacterium]|nr:NAD-dependent epimerase/dehydratase family protein [Methylomirabilota bacterium]